MDDGIVIIEPEGLPKDSFIGPEFSTFSRSKVDGKVKKKSSNNRHLASQTQTADT
uniref:Uncharacterized protein n=1 Tax=Ciona savignyi TaxID=51511 RepID=H2Y5N3_CIOSA